MSSSHSLVIDKHSLCLSLRTQTDSLAAHEPNLVSARIYQTRRSYLQVTQSLPSPSICLSLLCLLSPPHLHLLVSTLSLSPLLSPPPPQLLWLDMFPFTVVPLGLSSSSPPFFYPGPSQTNQAWGELDFAYRSYPTPPLTLPSVTRDREEKCRNRLHMKPLSNVMDELHLASANF